MSENLQPTSVTEAAAAAHVAVENEPDTARGGVLGLLLALLAIILGITSYMLWIFFQRESELLTHEKVLAKPSAALQALRTKEAEDLNGAGIVDKEAGVYRVPLQTGIQLFMREAEARKAQNQPQRIQAKAAPVAAESAEAAGEE